MSNASGGGGDDTLFQLSEPSTEIVPAGKPRGRAAKSAPAAKTPSGDTADKILGDWITFVQDGTGIPIPPIIVGRIAKQIKGLIQAGFTTPQIKYGLAAWIDEKMNTPLLSPQALDDLTWKFATDTSAQARAWRERVKARTSALASSARDAKARREESNKDASALYLEEQRRRRMNQEHS
mgnify:CR=1 FL=1